MRLPGYADTRWIWHRPAEPVIGFAPSGSRHPDVDEVPWLDDVDELATRWKGAGSSFSPIPALAGPRSSPPEAGSTSSPNATTAAAAITDADHAQVVSRSWSGRKQRNGLVPSSTGNMKDGQSAPSVTGRSTAGMSWTGARGGRGKGWFPARVHHRVALHVTNCPRNGAFSE